MQKIDISDYKREEIYYSDSAHKILNEELIFQLSGENFLIYKQNLIDSYKLNLFQDIKIEKQKTGFGYKRFFICPVCGKRRQYLYLFNDTYFVCRECTGKNIYKSRTNLYDESTTNIIKHKIIQQLKLLGDTSSVRCIADIPERIPSKPRYMRQKKYNLICRKLMELAYMYYRNLDKNLKLTIKDINNLLQDFNF